MPTSQMRLLATRRLLPFFLVQFLGAINDNLFKNALVILVAYRDTQNATATEIVVTIATALFILPYFLFSATAGQLADKYPKAALVRLVKLWEIGVMILAAFGFWLHSLPFQLAILFLLGVQATFFGPVKYGILPELLGSDELMAGNGLIEAGTFLAILIGTIAGGLLALAPHGEVVVTAVLLVVAVGGWIAARFVPDRRGATPELRLNPNIAAETWSILRYSQTRPEIGRAIIGISWFWLVGASYLAQFPNYAKVTLGANNQVVTLFLTVFSIGIGTGSLLCARLQKGQIDTRLVGIGALGMALFGCDFWLAGGSGAPPGALVGAIAFLAQPMHWRIVFDLFALSVFGGLYCVPLYVIMQARSDEHQRARVVASNNVMNAGFMVVSAVISVLMLRLGTGVGGIFVALVIGNFLVAGEAFYRRRPSPR